MIKFKYGKARCPLCLVNGGSRKQYEDIRLIKQHLSLVHSYNGVYSYIINQTPNTKGNYLFWVLGKCSCGCDELLTYRNYWMPNHTPPYYLSGHDQRLGLPNKGHYEEGHKSWNKGTKGLTGPNTGSFKKGNVPGNSRGGNYTAPNGQNFEWNGEYQPSGPRKYRPVSRRIMEEVLNRPLLPSEVIIHLDYDSSNDDPNNLEVKTRGQNATRNRWKGHTAQKKTKKKAKKKPTAIKKASVTKVKKAAVPKDKKASVTKVNKADVPKMKEAVVPRSSPFCPDCGSLLPPRAPCSKCMRDRRRKKFHR